MTDGDAKRTDGGGEERRSGYKGPDAPLDVEPVAHFQAPLARAAAMMRTLRNPIGGCPWDLEQTFATIAPYTIEEAYEVADAVERGDMEELCSELGDLLFQVLFHARMAEERGAFDLGDVADSLVAKMVRRHPHVFGDAPERDASAQLVAWEQMKAAERTADGAQSVLDGVAAALPALSRAEKLTKRAARIGFDWPTADAVLDKLEEELAELREARAGGDKAAIAEELGDVLFVLANLSRKLDVDPEAALRAANGKFVRRFGHVERCAATARAAGQTPDLETLERYWTEAKTAERT